jgi:hypothetical protein
LPSETLYQSPSRDVKLFDYHIPTSHDSPIFVLLQTNVVILIDPLTLGQLLTIADIGYPQKALYVVEDSLLLV